MKKRKITWLIFGGIGSATLFFCGCQFTRAGYESAEYSVESKTEGFEIRAYPELTIASTPMKTEGKGQDKSFMRLFGYISGENEDSEKISMTTPVFMQDEEMRFVLPKKVAEEGAPDATAPEVDVKTMPAGRYAVYRFTGGRSDAKVLRAKETLKKWLETNKLNSEGSIISAGYDPPFTPAMLQRNEVLVRLKG